MISNDLLQMYIYTYIYYTPLLNIPFYLIGTVCETCIMVLFSFLRMLPIYFD